jgi:hypothetical protein
MKNLFHCILIVLATISGVIAQSTIYISPTGTSSGAGTIASPKGLEVFDSNNLGPGSTIIMMDGTYNLTADRYFWQKTGSATSPITIKAQNKHMAILKGTNTYNSGHYGVLSLSGCKYIVVDGLTVMHDANSQDQVTGIRITTASGVRSEFVTVKNCKVYGHGGGGINADGSDHIIIENNIVYDNSTRNAINTSGISVYKMKAVTANSDYWGIIIRGNICYGNKCTLDFYYNENGNIYQSDKPTDGNGIILDLLDDDANPRVPYGKRVLVENNLCYNNGGAGIKAYKSSLARIVNNTVYHNNTVLSIENTTNAEIILFELQGVNGVYNEGIYNNVVVADPNLPNLDYAMVVDFDMNKVYNNYLVGAGAKFTNYTYSTSDFATSNTINPITSQTLPKFINPGLVGTSNFKLQPTSPLIGAYTEAYGPTVDLLNVARPQGTYTDLGAYEFIYATGVTLNTNSTIVAPNKTVQLTATVAPSNATYKNLTWTSSNTAVATVNGSGLVSGVAAGTVTITAKTVDGNKTATCTVLVQTPCGLLENQGFETGNFTKWTATAGQTSIVTSPVKAGSYAGRVTGTGSITYATNIAVSGTRNVEFKGWIRMDATPSDAYLSIEYLASDGTTVIRTDKTTVPSNTAMTEYKVTRTSPSNTASVRLRAYKSGSGNFTIDNLCFTSAAVTARESAEEVKEDIANIYPNPASDFIRVPVLDASERNMDVELLDMTGRSVINKSFETPENQGFVEVNISSLQTGLYLVKAKQGFKENVQKMIKQ